MPAPFPDLPTTFFPAHLGVTLRTEPYIPLLEEIFPFEQYPGSGDALLEQIKAFRHVDASGAEQPWSANAKAFLAEMQRDPYHMIRFMQDGNKSGLPQPVWHELYLAPGRCHPGDNHLTALLAQTFAGWRAGATPTSPKALVTAILKADLDELRVKPLCPVL